MSKLLLAVLIGLTTTLTAWAGPDADALNAAATKALRAGKYAEALTSYDRLIREHPQDARVSQGQAGYMRIICLLNTKQPEKAIAAGTRHLERFAGKPLTPWVYVLQHRAYAQLGKAEQGKQALRALIAKHPDSKAAANARKLLTAKPRAPKRDFFADEDQPYAYPRRALLDSPVRIAARQSERADVYLVLTNLKPEDPYYKVVERIVAHRDASAVVSFSGDAFYSRQMLAALRKLQPDYAVFVTRPETLDPNFAYDAFEMSAMVDSDPFTDYLYGFVTGQSAAEALAFYERIIKAEGERAKLPKRMLRCGPSTVDTCTKQQRPGDAGFAVTSLYWDSRKHDKSPFMIQHLDKLRGNGVISMFGHGCPERVVHGYTPQMVRKSDLYPAVVFNGACYTGSTHRVINDGDRRAARNSYRTIEPGGSLCLAFLGSGVTAYFGAFSPDRGNVSSYERQFAMTSGAPLGAVAKYSYDLIVMGNHGSWFSFPRFYEGQPNPVADGHRNHQTLQLIGNGTRVLFGDPQYQPFARQHDGYVQPEVVAQREREVTLRIVVHDAAPESFFNVYHWLKDRLYCKWKLPEGVDGIAGVELGKVVAGDLALKAARPIWRVEQTKRGRYLHLEVDIDKADSRKVIRVGAYAELTIRLGKRLASHLDQARAAGDRLLAQLVADGEGKRLKGVQAKDELGLYHGPAGVAVLLANLGAASGEARYGQAAVALMRRLNRLAAEQEQIDPGLYTGLAGIGWANLVVHRQTGDAQLLAAARTCAKRLAGVAPRATDVISGAAGTALFLIDLHRQTQDPALLQELERLAAYLHKTAVADKRGGLKWPAHPAQKLASLPVVYPGFSHGTAGVGYVFACLHELTGVAKHLETARQAARQLTAIAEDDQQGRGLKWYHWEPNKREVYKHQWCHGAPGIGLFFLKLYEVGKHAEDLAVARKAAYSTYTSGRYYRSGANQCHGIAGNAELLLEMARVTGEDSYRRWAEDMGEMVRWRAHREGDQLYWDAHDWRSGKELPSYMVGSSGVAHFLLRLAKPEVELPFMIRTR